MTFILNIYTLISILLVFLTWVFAIFLFLQKNKSFEHRAFTWLLVAIAVWMNLDILTSFSLGDFLDLTFWRLGYFAAFGLAMATFRFVIVFAKKKIYRWLDIVMAMFLVAYFILTVLTDKIIVEVTSLEFPGQPNFISGEFFYWNLFLLFSPVVGAFVFASFKYFTKKNRKDKHLKWLWLGLLPSFLIAPLTNVLLPYFGLDFPKLANFATFLSMSLYAYAVYTDKLFDISLKNFKIRTKITFTSVIQFVLILIVIVFVVSNFVSGIINDQIRNSLTDVAQSRSQHMETYFDQNMERLKLVTSRTKLRNVLKSYNQNNNQEDLDTLTGILIDAKEPSQDFERICLLDLNGNVLASSDDNFCGTDFSNQDFFIKGKEKESVSFVKLGDSFEMFVSGPIILNEELLGVGVTVINLRDLKTIISDSLSLRETGEIFVAFKNQDGTMSILFERRFEKDALPAIDESAKEVCPIKDALAGKAGFYEESIDYRGVNVMAVSSFIDSADLGMVVKIDREEAFKEISKLSVIVFYIIVFSVFIYYFLSKYIASTIIRPLEKLSLASKEIEAGNLNYKIEVEGKDETADLAKRFNLMVEAVKKSRKEVDAKVKSQTKEITKVADEMKNQQKAILNILEDVDGEKEKAKELATKFQTLTANIPGVTYRCKYDKDWTMLFISDYVANLSGYKPDDLINNKNISYNEIIYPDDRKYVANEINKAIKNKKSWQIEYRIINKSGEILWVSENGRLVKDFSQEPILDGIIMDITERKKLEATLIENFNDLEKFKLAVDNASDHIVITDANGVVIYANSGVEKITGFKPKEIIGQKAGTKENWGGLMKTSDYKKMWQTIKKDKKPYYGEIKNRRKNGEEYDVLANISPVLTKDGEVIFFVGIERDITVEKQIDKAKTEFVSLASHQLRTPLSTINWYSEMLIDGDAGKLSKDQVDYVKEIYAGSQRMVDLVNALLNVSRLELGTFVVEPEKASITKIADGAIDEIKHKIKEKKQKFSKKYDKNIPKMMLDKKLSHIIFQNLLSNAMKYTPAGGKVELKISKNKTKVTVEVKDNGMGIPKKQQEQIFQKLFRADNVRKTDTEGTGLGLYIIKQIVDHAGGKIWFESKVNKGTTFFVELPLKGMKAKSGTKELS